MAEQEDNHLEAREKLKLLKSPLVKDQISYEGHHEGSADGLLNLQGFGGRKGAYKSTPEFQRHEDASLLELFYDLFFTANYTVFSETQSVSSPERFKAYVGYFCLLWMTWMMVSFYDVRFLADSWFERVAKAIHLGVMVGFAVVAPQFDPEDQNPQTFRTMSLILFISRIALAIEYGSILWHVRKFKRAQMGLYAQIGLHVFAALVYLGVTFSFKEGIKHGHGFVAWYLLSVAEGLMTLFLSNVWPVLSLTNTHLMRRMGLLTVIVLGDGIVVLAKDVVTIVEAPHSWNAVTVGVVTAATATIYFIFLVYFDWMKYEHLPAWRQQLWTTIHFPFHLALVLFIQGFTQFVLWFKIFNEGKQIVLNTILYDPASLARANTSQVAYNVTNVTNEFFMQFPPKVYATWEAADEGLYNLTEIPNKFWPQLAKWLDTRQDADIPTANVAEYNYILYVLSNAMLNALLETFSIDLHSELAKELEKTNQTISSADVEATVNQESSERYFLVFTYGYVAAGCALVLMVMLTIVSRTTPWKPWPIARVVINLLLALGTGLVATLYYHPHKAGNFLSSTWVLPTITLVWLVVLFLTHIGNTAPVFSKSAAGLFNFSFRRAPTVRSTAGYGLVSNTGVWEGSRKPTQDVQQMELSVRHHTSLYGQTGYDGSEYGIYQPAPETAYTGGAGRGDFYSKQH